MIVSKNSLTFLLVVLTLTVQCPSGSVQASPMSTNGSVAAAINAFSLDLYGKLKKPGQNLFLSPYSASVALSMAYAGAGGVTESQMAKVLHYTTGKEQVHSALAALQREIKQAGADRGISLNMANALWGQQGYGFREPFLKVLEKQYLSRFREVDFKGAPDKARAEINRWANDETKGRIKNIIAEPINPDTRLILANAIYFKGMWDSKFDKARTENSEFLLPNGSKMPARLMHMTTEFGYLEGQDFQALELPYQGNRFSMVVLLPRRNDGLEEIEKSVTAETLSEWLKQMGSKTVEVFLPRFKMTDTLDLIPPLCSLGMVAAFSAREADFLGMTVKEVIDLYIEKVVQKSYVEVNEEGTEAAAVTVIQMPMKGAREPAPIPVFRADHPFMFLIRYRPTNCILFMGRVVKPDLN